MEPVKTAETIITYKHSNSTIYNKIIKILNNLTGIVWGFVQSGRRVKYLSSVELPIKIGILWGKKYEKNIKYKLDISISNKSPAMFYDEDLWIEALTSELQVGLRCILECNDDLLQKEKILASVNKWKPVGEFAEMIAYADEQLRLYAASGGVLEIDCNDNTYDPWLEACLQQQTSNSE